MTRECLLLCAGLPGALFAQNAVNLPEVTVYSPRVANQSPAGTFAMPISALRYEPRVDIHSRNLAEAQADVTIRGGIFENTGFSVGAVSLLDPQTGHYVAEIPIAPSLLTAPEVRTGAARPMLSATIGPAGGRLTSGAAPRPSGVMRTTRPRLSEAQSKAPPEAALTRASVSRRA